MAKQVWNPGAMLAPLPPALVTCGQGEDINVLTIGWTGILCTKPPKTYISVRPERHSHHLLEQYGLNTLQRSTLAEDIRLTLPTERPSLRTDVRCFGHTQMTSARKC